VGGCGERVKSEERRGVSSDGCEDGRCMGSENPSDAISRPNHMGSDGRCRCSEEPGNRSASDPYDVGNADR
jgi:hypothetical protein